MTATSVRVKGFTRPRYLLVLLAISALVAIFLWRTVHLRDGLGATVVLCLASLALARWGGPYRLAREITIRPDEIEIARFTTVTSRIRRNELSSVGVLRDKHNRLALTPIEPKTFFARHPELADSRVHTAVEIPIGKNPATADELEAALA